MALESPSLSVIVPTLNEAENIEGIIGKILAGGASLDMEIIVVDDNSRDNTQEIVRRLAQTLPVTLLARDKPKDGLAGAVLAGARAAKAKVVMVIDADGSHPPEKIPELALPVIHGERDMVIGSRYTPGGSTPGWSRKRRIMSRAASACAWPLTDVHDALSGFFAVRQELMAEIPSDAAGFKIALEILVRGGDTLRVGEVPIAFRDRELGQSKMGTRVIFTYFRRLVALSGWRESKDPMGVALTKTLVLWAVDFAIFAAAWFLHAGLSGANLLGFAAGAILNAWLKLAQLSPENRKVGPFLPRLLFVSLLSLFLRSGVLATFANAFEWPALLAVVPAIVTGWIVLFSGYALYIWPDRNQYGSGVRWRVAGVVGTAYLFALRFAFLYAMPVDTRVFDLTSNPGHLTRIELATMVLRHWGTLVLGPNSAGFNLPAPICWIIGAWAVFSATQRVTDKTNAFRALLLFSALPVFFNCGAVFSIETLLLCGWAVVLWLMTFARAWSPRLASAYCAVLAAIFWLLPGFGGITSPSPLLLIVFTLEFIVFQLLLVTPMAPCAIAGSFIRQPRPRYLTVAAGLGAAAAIITFLHFLTQDASVTAAGAIWLPLLPIIAADLQQTGRPPSRIWAGMLYACVLLYGFYFYYLAFSQ